MTRRRAGAAEASLGRLIDETRTLFHHLKRAEETHAADALNAGERAILMDLRRNGSRTVPDMARARPVSRQHIQMLVNPLLERRLVKLVDNPRHQRSKLVALTPAGRAMTTRLAARESQILADVAAAFDADDLGAAAHVLSRVREHVDRKVRAARSRKGDGDE